MFAHTTHECIVKLSEKLARLTQTLDKVFYASDGACAVEVALKMSLHSHTHSGNALAASVALACLDIIDEEKIYTKVEALQSQMHEHMRMIADTTGKLTNIRYIGGIVAADLQQNLSLPRLGFAISQAAIKHGALLCPIGNTLYWLPPLNTEESVLVELKEATQKAILDCY